MQSVTELAIAQDSPAKARRLIGEALKHCPEQLVADAQLLTSELVTNAVVYGSPPIQLDIQLVPGTLRVAVSDGNPDHPVMQDAGPVDPHGRGLMIIDWLAQAWGVIAASAERLGKTVWFSLAV